MQENLNNAFVEVRKAYRLLADYQKKVLDLVDFIGNSFGRTYAGGHSKYGDPTPRNGKGSLDLWSWDWLTMYFYEFSFGTENINNQELTFSVFIVSDTGYYDEKTRNKTLDKRDTEVFTSPQESETKLIFLVGKDMWEHKGVFVDNFNKPEFLTKSGGKESDEKGIMLYKSYSLANFSNQKNAEEQLKDFEQYCKSYDIEFKFIEKKI